MTLVFDRLTREPAYQKISKAIEDKILSRALAPGDALPSETALAEQFGVNRATVREGLRQLEMAGLVERRPGSKKFAVATPRAADVAAGVSRALKLNEVTFAEVWEAMMVVEPACARLAATRASESDVASLREIVDGLHTDDADLDGAVEQVVRFFQRLAELAGNRALKMTEAPLATLLRPSLRLVLGRVLQARTRIKDAQLKILDACAAHDAEAAERWMTKHIVDFRRGYEIAGIALDKVIPLG